MSGEFEVRVEIDLEARLRILLPELYRDRYEDVQPFSMGSAGLKFAPDGTVAWDEMWGSFCDLAMAGGPPHKGTLLEPGRPKKIEAQPDRYREVVAEICRGIHLVTGLYARQADLAGWVRVDCTSAAMAGWLARAIVMENVSADFNGLALFLPAGPEYRLEKEIKNVITVIAKTCHYWSGHTSLDEHDAIAGLLRMMEQETPLIRPAHASDSVALRQKMQQAVEQETGLRVSSHAYSNWLGFECHGIKQAIWMMRALVAYNVLSRREGTAVFLPVDPATDQDGKTVIDRLVRVHRLAAARKIFE